MTRFPDAGRAYPVELPDGSAHKGTVFLNRVIDHPNFEIGAYSYASDFDPPEDWAGHLAPYLFEGGADHLSIGKFCQIAHGARFITSGANHAMDGLTTFPFPIFDPEQIGTYRPDSRNTVVGNDVWVGYGAIICPGARVGNGVIIGAGAIVRGDVPDYAVVVGNPAQVVRMRFGVEQVQQMQKIAWWKWPTDKIAQAVPALLSGDISALENF